MSQEMESKDIKTQAKWSAIATGIVIVPLVLIAVGFSNVHAGPGNAFLFWVGVFILLPLFALSEMGLFPGGIVGWFVVALLQPLWIFLLIFLGGLFWRAAKS